MPRISRCCADLRVGSRPRDFLRQVIGMQVLRSGQNPLLKSDLVADARDLHSRLGVGAAGDDGFFFVALSYPYLAVEAVAVPAEVGVRDALEIQVLQTAENGVVFRDEFFLAEDGDLDQAVMGLEHFGMGFHVSESSFPQSREDAKRRIGGLGQSANEIALPYGQASDRMGLCR